MTLRRLLVIPVLAFSLAAAAQARAQVTFQSAEVIGVPAADKNSADTSPTRHPDRTVRFWSDDGLTYHLDGFGCRFDMAAWPDGLDEVDHTLSSVLTTDIESYRKAASGAVSNVGVISNVFTGLLNCASAGPAGKDSYGMDCNERMITAVALDVLKTPGYRQLRIFVVQADLDDLAAGKAPRKAMSVSFMENTLFRQGDPEALANRAPLTADLYQALTR